jgi:hypothetical protein
MLYVATAHVFAVHLVDLPCERGERDISDSKTSTDESARERCRIIHSSDRDLSRR